MAIPASDLFMEHSRVRAKARIIKHGVDDYTGEVLIDRSSIDGNPNIDAFEKRLDASGWDEIEFHHWQKRGALYTIKNGLRDIFESHHVDHNPESEWEYDFSGRFRPRNMYEVPTPGAEISLPETGGLNPPPVTYGDTPSTDTAGFDSANQLRQPDKIDSCGAAYLWHAESADKSVYCRI